jgi:hypothetical protein
VVDDVRFGYGRETGESKFKIKEMGSRYFFIILYCLIEKYFARVVRSGSKFVTAASNTRDVACGVSRRYGR